MLTSARLGEINAALGRRCPYLADVIDSVTTQSYIASVSPCDVLIDGRSEQQAWLEDGPADEVAEWIETSDYCLRRCPSCGHLVDAVTGEGHAADCDRQPGLESCLS